MKAVVRILVLSWALIAPHLANAQPMPMQELVERTATPSQIIGLDPAAVRAKFSDVPESRPIHSALVVATPSGTLTFVALYDLVRDPIAAETPVRSQSPNGETKLSYRECHQYAGAPDRSHEVSYVLMFRNGALETVYGDPDPDSSASRPPPPRAGATRKEVSAWGRQRRETPYVSSYGALPLDDGVEFLSRWRRHPVDAGTALIFQCGIRTIIIPAPKIAAGRHGAGNLQGLALAPFALALPAINGQRAAARKQGLALLSTVSVGDQLGQSPEKFARGHVGVRAYSGPGRYSVLTIDLGDDPSRNLSNNNDAAMIGVRDGRIEWIAASQVQLRMDLSPELLCLDDHGIPGRVRAGCGEWGQFKP